jgi:uncharacterized RDD family membrane protein YckC
MREAAGTWLEGPAFQRSGGPRGSSLGVPEQGPGSLASPGIRIAAFVIDAFVANLLAGLPYLFGVRYGQGERGYAVYAAFLLAEFVLVSVAGATIGKQVCRIRVVRADGGRLAPHWVLARTLLLGILIPAVIWDRDGRGLHDRAAGALTIRTGGPAAASGPGSASASAPSRAAAPARETGAASARPAAKAAPARSAGKSQPKRRRKRR